MLSPTDIHFINQKMDEDEKWRQTFSASRLVHRT